VYIGGTAYAGGGAYATGGAYAGAVDSAQNGAVTMAAAPSTTPAMTAPGHHHPPWPPEYPPYPLPPAQAADVSQWLYQKGSIKKPVPYTQLVADGYLP